MAQKFWRKSARKMLMKLTKGRRFVPSSFWCGRFARWRHKLLPIIWLPSLKSKYWIALYYNFILKYCINDMNILFLNILQKCHIIHTSSLKSFKNNLKVLILRYSWKVSEKSYIIQMQSNDLSYILFHFHINKTN